MHCGCYVPANVEKDRASYFGDDWMATQGQANNPLPCDSKLLSLRLQCVKTQAHWYQQNGISCSTVSLLTSLFLMTTCVKYA